MSKYDGRYSVCYGCSNCLYTLLVWIPKRIEAPTRMYCPNCECDTLKKLDKHLSGYDAKVFLVNGRLEFA